MSKIVEKIKGLFGCSSSKSEEPVPQQQEPKTEIRAKGNDRSQTDHEGLPD